MDTYEKARAFMYRHARPLELAVWRNRFEDGERSAVLAALMAYQNPDGGFGHALEADYWNTDSTPVAVWKAVEILRSVGLQDPLHPLVQGILRYLDSGADFDEAHGQWRNAVPGNNGHPHAAWWHWNGESEFNYNPTAELAGFAVRFAEPDSALYAKAARIAREAYTWFSARVPFEEQHVTKCFIRLYELLDEADSDLVDMDAFEALLKRQVKACICPDEARWYKEYVTRPSMLIDSPLDLFYRGSVALVEREAELMPLQQLPDGSWPVTWRWGTEYPQAEAVSIDWWRGTIILENITFLREFGKV